MTICCMCMLFADIKDYKFYFVSFEYLCETEEGDFLPAEVGLIEWSLNQGISKTLHRFINPGVAVITFKQRFVSSSKHFYRMNSLKIYHPNCI